MPSNDFVAGSGEFVQCDSGLYIPVPVRDESPRDLLPEHLRRYLPEEPERYMHFRHPYSREDLYQMSKSTVEYIGEHGVKALVLVDRSSRPFGTAVKAYWDVSHQDELRTAPDVYFINPNGVAHGLASIINRRSHKSKFLNEHPFLNDHKDDAVLLLDTCIHTGRTAKPLLKAFDDAGFKDIRFGVASEERNSSGIVPDVALLPETAFERCYPFGSEASVDTNGSELHSRRSDFHFLHSVGQELRDEIRRIICEGYVAEKTSRPPAYETPQEISVSALGLVASFLRHL